MEQNIKIVNLKAGKVQGAEKMTEPPPIANFKSVKVQGAEKVTEPPPTATDNVEECRLVLVDMIKTSKRLRKMYTKLSKDGSSTDLLDRFKFEMIVSQAIAKKYVDVSLCKYDKEKVWRSANGGKETSTGGIEFVQMVKWLVF